MSDTCTLDLSECTAFRQAVEARPPRIVHGTVILLTGLLGAGLLWAGLTRVDLVVRTTGRIRPMATPTRVFNPARGDGPAATASCRVSELNFREGASVRRGAVLFRLDTERLDNEIARRKRTIQAGREELAQLERLQRVTQVQFEAAHAKAESELAAATEEVRLARQRQARDIGLAEVELESARDVEGRLRRLAIQRAAAAEEMVRAVQKVREAQQKLTGARVPVDESKVAVAQRALKLAEKDHAVKVEELALKRGAKLAEVEGAQIELRNLELERKQAVVCAPMDGVVITGDIKVGDLLEPGKAVVEMAQQTGFLFEAAVPSEEVAHLCIGLPARIKLDAYDYQKYGTLEGTVCFLSPDSAVPQGQKAAHYVVRIEVHGDEVGRSELRGPVKLGMAGQVEIVTDQESLLLLLVQKLRQSFSLG